MTVSRSHVWFLVSAGAFLALVGVMNLVESPKWGITSAVLGLVALVVAFGFMVQASGKSPKQVVPQSLQKWTKLWLAMYLVVTSISIVFMFLSSEFSLSDLMWTIPLALFSWGIWGAAAYFLIGVPLWALWKLASSILKRSEARSDV